MNRETHELQRLSALVDDELSPHERERVLAHVAACDPCRQALQDERRAKRVITGEQRVIGRVPDRLVGDLLRLAEPGEPLALTRRDEDGRRQPVPPPRELPDQHARRVRRAVVALLLAVAAAAVMLLVLHGALGG